MRWLLTMSNRPRIICHYGTVTSCLRNRIVICSPCSASRIVRLWTINYPFVLVSSDRTRRSFKTEPKVSSIFIKPSPGIFVLFGKITIQKVLQATVNRKVIGILDCGFLMIPSDQSFNLVTQVQYIYVSYTNFAKSSTSAWFWNFGNWEYEFGHVAAAWTTLPSVEK